MKGGKGRLTLTWIEVGKTDILNRELIEIKTMILDMMNDGKDCSGQLPLIDGDL